MSDEHVTEQEMDEVLRTWLQDEPAGRPDRSRVAGAVVGQLHSTRRRRRRWWPFGRSVAQPTPIPAANGHSPTVIGRTQTMISPAKAITAGAIVFALGSALFIAQPLYQQGSVPGAEAEPVAPTWVTGNIAYAMSCTGPDSEQDGAARHEWNYECSPQIWTASDPRLTGEVAARWNDDVYQTADAGTIAVNSSAAYLRNGDGGWTCISNNLYKGGGLFPQSVTGDTWRCVGEGGYEGLSALLVAPPEPARPFFGLIFSGDAPPVPEPPAAE